MSEDSKPTMNFYCKFCDESTEQEFAGEDRKETFTITFHCPKCGSYHVFEFFGSQFEQPTELD